MLDDREVEMSLERHAITSPARRAAFWPSIAQASAQFEARRPLGNDRTDAEDAATLKPAPGTTDSRRDAEGMR